MIRKNKGKSQRLWQILLCLLWLCSTGIVYGNGAPSNERSMQSMQGNISLTLREVDIAEAMEMLSRKERVNILLSDGVSGEVSVNLYDVSLHKAIESIATAGGYAVEYRNRTYFIVKHDEIGQYAPAGLTEIRTFKVQYTKPDAVEAIVKNHISKYGKVTMLEERRLLVVEDTPEFLRRIDRLLKQIDRRPKQILIEAKILEVTLRDTESFGLDWAKLFEHDDGNGVFGVRGLANPNSPGLFFQLLTPNVEVFLDSLQTNGRLRALATPKLLALEDQEAETVIGDRLGYRVTTTINQVTSESIEFLESGVILKVKPSVDESGRIMLDIHPEVSTGSVSDDGIPSQTTTEVTTQMLVQDGQTVFIGGLIKQAVETSKEGIPILGKTPGIRWLFSNHASRVTNTETIVLITPYIITDSNHLTSPDRASRMEKKRKHLDGNTERTRKQFRDFKGAVDRSMPRPPTVTDVETGNTLGAIDLWSDEDIL